MQRGWLGIGLMMLMAGAVTPIMAQDESCSSEVGTVIESEIESDVLGKTKNYTVDMTPDWCSLDDLPLLVMLHGAGGDNNSWVRGGEINSVADEMILAGEIDPLVILMPDGGNSAFINGVSGNYGTFITEELIPLVEATYPIAGTRESRFVGGFSMGGFGALYLGVYYPDVFSKIGGHSPALPVRYDLVTPDDAEPKPHNLPYMFEQNGLPEGTQLWLDVGESDGLIRGVRRMAQFLDEHDIPYELHIWPGGHNFMYWHDHTPDYLRFYVGKPG